MPILLFLLITALNTEFYIFLLYAFLLFSPPTLETAQVLRKLIKLRKFLMDDYSKKLGEMLGHQ